MSSFERTLLSGESREATSHGQDSLNFLPLDPAFGAVFGNPPSGQCRHRRIRQKSTENVGFRLRDSSRYCHNARGLKARKRLWASGRLVGRERNGVPDAGRVLRRPKTWATNGTIPCASDSITIARARIK